MPKPLLLLVLVQVPEELRPHLRITVMALVRNMQTTFNRVNLRSDNHLNRRTAISTPNSLNRVWLLRLKDKLRLVRISLDSDLLRLLTHSTSNKAVMAITDLNSLHLIPDIVRQWVNNKADMGITLLHPDQDFSHNNPNHSLFTPSSSSSSSNSFVHPSKVLFGLINLDRLVCP